MVHRRLPVWGSSEYRGAYGQYLEYTAAGCTIKDLGHTCYCASCFQGHTRLCMEVVSGPHTGAPGGSFWSTEGLLKEGYFLVRTESCLEVISGAQGGTGA